jgi:hypothetical protein
MCVYMYSAVRSIGIFSTEMSLRKTYNIFTFVVSSCVHNNGIWVPKKPVNFFDQLRAIIYLRMILLLGVIIHSFSYKS